MKAEPVKPALSEQSRIVLVVAGALATGGVLQFFVEPGPQALVIAAVVAGSAVLAASRLLPGRWRELMAGFRFTSVLLTVLGAAAVLGTLILQRRPLEEYPARYGAAGDLIVALRLDDIFHSLWFACLLALFAAAVVNSALLRWPPRLRNLGFFVCHLGLLASLVGAGLSSFFSVRGRIDLLSGGASAREVIVTRAGEPVVRYDAAGRETPVTAPLGFELRLDRFDLVRYDTEYRVGYYEQRTLPDGGMEWRLRASFDPEPGVRHMLPGGNAFTLTQLWPGAAGDAGAADGGPAAVLRVRSDGAEVDTPRLAALGRENFAPVRQDGRVRGMLAFEKRSEEAKTFRSHVTALAGGREAQGLVEVNAPFTFGGWTFYQVNFDARNPRYSGLEAVRDPGVGLVFAGFALIIAGVAFMFYAEPRLRRARPAPEAAPAEAKAAA